MEIEDILSFDQRIEITFGEGEKSLTTVSRVEDVTEDTITIAMPYINGLPAPLEVGEEVVVRFSTHNQYYSFSTTVKSRARSPVPVINLNVPERIHSSERRQYVRVKASVMITLTIPSDPGQTRTISGTSFDLSGGGLLTILREPITVGTDLAIKMTVSPEEIIEVEGRVVRCDLIRDVRRYRIGIQFVNISEKVRDRIIRVVFHHLRESLESG